MTIQSLYPGAVVQMPDGSVITMEEFKRWHLESYLRPFTGSEDEANQVIQGFLAQQQQDRASEAGSWEGMFESALPGLLFGGLMAGAGAFSGLGGSSTSGFGFGSPESLIGSSGTSGGSMFDWLSGLFGSPTSSLSQSDLAALIESGTQGTAGLALENAALGSGSFGLNSLGQLVNLGTSGTNLYNQLLGGGTGTSGMGSLLLPLLGGLLGSQSGAQQAGTTTSITDIPEWQKPYVMGLMDAASKAFGSGGLQNMAGGNEAANQELMKTMQGGYLPAFQFNPFGGQQTGVPSNPFYGMNNPYLEKALSQTLNDVTGRVQSQAYGSGAFGGSANQELLTRNLADAANQVRYQDFYNQAQLGEADVNRRLQTSLADVARNASLWNTDMTRNLANFQQERGRQFASATGYPDFMGSSVNAAFSPFTAYGNIVGRNFGSQTSTPFYNNPFGGALSGALGGLALSKAFG